MKPVYKGQYPRVQQIVLFIPNWSLYIGGLYIQVVFTAYILYLYALCTLNNHYVFSTKYQYMNINVGTAK